MADVHIEAGNTPASPYATWAGSAAAATDAVGVMAAGDTAYLSSAHVEASAGVSLTIPGTSTAITRLISGTKGVTSGITAVAAGAVIESTSTTFTVAGSFYAEGITYKVTSSSGLTMQFASSTGNQQYHKACMFWINGSNSGSTIRFGVNGASGNAAVVLESPSFRFGAAAQRVNVDGALAIRGGGIDPASTAITGLFGIGQSTRACRLTVDDFDASAAATSANIVASVTQSGTFSRFRRLKLPVGWTGAFVAAGQVRRGDRHELIDYSVGTTLYKRWIETYAGSDRDESTVKVTGHTRSYRVTTSADCSLIAPMRSGEYFVPLSGLAQTLTLDVCTDGVTLTDAEIHLEVSYFAASGSALGTVVSDAVASVIAAPANQASSSTPWTTTGLSSPVRQALSVSVTAGYASYAIVRAVVRRASTTVYLDDQVQVA
jgi:hypothetical protein